MASRSLDCETIHKPFTSAPAGKDDVDQSEKRDFYNGFGDGLARAFEFAVTPAIFGFLGYLLDHAVGTVPLFTIALSLLCVVGMFLKTWYTYDLSMREQEAKAPWARVDPAVPAKGRHQ